MMPAKAAHIRAVETHIVNCPHCGSDDNTYVTGLICDGASHNLKEPYRTMSFRLNECRACQLIYQRERLSQDEMDNLYDADDYLCYQSFMDRGWIIRNLAMLSAKQLVKEIEQYRPKDNNLLVDYGCGSGPWLELFKMVNAPWKLVGTEIDASIIQDLEKRGFKGFVCHDDTINEVFKPNEVGVFYMHHVIEHLASPLKTLGYLREALSPGGIIAGQTPDVQCWERSIFKDHWAQWHLPYHLTVFDKTTLRRMAEKAGFEVVSLKSSPSGATQWSLSLLKARAHQRGRVFKWTAEPMYTYLTLVFAPLSIVQSKVHHTSHLDFIFRKSLN